MSRRVSDVMADDLVDRIVPPDIFLEPGIDHGRQGQPHERRRFS